ncbi:CaiB/BaiF CoA transferase family protein [Aestuariirhabdus litorea]|uniref:CoA transferase n=1 Tax=Aestuariirhabdus litorea TaxID=2528527 RepID=A0A3P3VNV8_9GAMM|nr:CaiB/BaiF CoA-transferase family protein [Aestuariirhabdus litorea]RRJ84442.1 CoA transferase [Aestuariirhabdus litorea]RWW97666.1 CoA transferase [Endozoicomonadaceae bacterium GTF-13]
MNGALKGLKVLDFSTLLPGPYATMMLADMGADVLRIESPTRPDLVKLLPPMDAGTSTAHAYLNRGKASLALDLKQPEAVEVVKRLVLEYDILVEQFRPGVMARLGLDYETLRAINPRLIYCSVTGYGQTGPYRDRAGHDINYLATAGVSSYTGRRDTGPCPIGVQVADVGGGSFHAVMGILAAVIERQGSGEGQSIDISMTDASFAMNAMAGAAWLGGGVEAELESTALNGGSFYDYYRTRDGRYFAVGSLEPQFMAQLCQALGCEEFASQGLSPDPRVQQQIKQRLSEAFADQDFAYWCERFAALDACVEPVLSLAEASQHPQLVAREMVVEVPREDGSLQPQPASPLRFSRSHSRPTRVGGALGSDGGRVLRSLGYSEAEVDAMKAARITL